jgi:hypothetical protein
MGPLLEILLLRTKLGQVDFNFKGMLSLESLNVRGLTIDKHLKILLMVTFLLL